MDGHYACDVRGNVQCGNSSAHNHDHDHRHHHHYSHLTRF